MAAGSFLETQALAYLLQGATATRNTSWSVGLSLGNPTQASLSEVAAGSGYTRSAVGFAASVENTYTNTAAVTFGVFSSNATMSGCFVVNGAGSLLAFGTMSPATAVARGSLASFGSGALRVSLL